MANRYKQINVDEDTHLLVQELAASEGRTMAGQVRYMAQVIAELASLRREVAELKDRNSTYLMRLKQEEAHRETWQARALQAEAQ